MKRFASNAVERLASTIFQRAGSKPEEAATIARRLVDANLVGHDSHGVIRIPQYIERVLAKEMIPNQTIEVVSETDVLAVVDGRFGFGQTIGEQTMQLAIRKCAHSGISVVALRNSGHLGRIGDWAIMAAEAGKISLHWVNTSGGGILVAPFGGSDRRLSADPIAAGIPVKGGSPIVADLSACVIANGKIRVARNKGVPVPEGCLIDANGQPTTDPEVFYANPPGAILPFAGHKGFALGVLVETLAGALSGGGASNPENPSAHMIVNNMLTVVLDPAVFMPEAAYSQEIDRFVAWVKGSPPIEEGGSILMPGEPEERSRAERRTHGLEIDDKTWDQITAAARSVGMNDTDVVELMG